MSTTECRWIPVSDVDRIAAHIAEGWSVVPDVGHHGFYSILLTREERKKDEASNEGDQR